MAMKKTELEELAERLLSAYSTSDRHYEITSARRVRDDYEEENVWSLTIREVKDEKGTEKERE